MLIVITVLAPVYVMIFLRPAKQVTAEDLDDPPLFRYVEVTVDRIEPLPWTIHNQHKTLVARFALAWIGNRALLIRTDPEIPPGPTLHGMMQSLHGEEKAGSDVAADRDVRARPGARVAGDVLAVSLVDAPPQVPGRARRA